MADARDTLREGNVKLTLEQLKQEVRKAPRDPRLRTFLFQMFCITGEWDRALTQLIVAHELDPATNAMMQTYQSAIRCEMLREKVFKGLRTPTVFGDPGDWVPLLIEANRLLAAGDPEQAAKLRDAAFDLAPDNEAVVNGKAVAWIGDSDPRLGPILEAVIEGKYVWVPYHRMKSVKFDPPQDLRDQVWMPASFRWTNDGEAVGFVPTRYPASEISSDPAIQLARRTEWFDKAEGWSVPLGQRVFVTDEDDLALMDIRIMAMKQPGGADAGGADADGVDAESGEAADESGTVSDTSGTPAGPGAA